MASDIIPFLAVALLVSVVALGYAGIVIYEKKTGKTWGNDKATSSADSLNDTLNTMD